MASEAKLSIMIKPPVAMARALASARSAVGLHDRSPADRLHCTMLDLGDAAEWPAYRIARLCQALDAVSAEPFEVAFDRLEERTLWGQPGAMGARAFHAELKRQLCLAGFTLPLHIFALHLGLAATGPGVTATMIDPIGWLVEDFRLIRSVHGDARTPDRHEELGRWALERRQYGLAL